MRSVKIHLRLRVPGELAMTPADFYVARYLYEEAQCLFSTSALHVTRG